MNALHHQAEAAVSQRATTRLAVVDGYDPANYAVRVRYQPEGQLSGWLPVLTPWSGQGWGLFCPPTPGDQVVVHHPDGVHGAGVVGLRSYSDQDRPLPVPIGEFWLVHQTGACVKLTNDGRILVNSATEVDIGMAGTPLHQIVTDAFVALFNAHTHSGVQSGGSNTGAPNQTMDNTCLTSILRAN